MASSAIIGANRHRTLIPASRRSGCHLGLSIVLAHAIGVVGVAIGSLIPSVLVAVGYIPLCLSRATGIPPATYYRQAWLLPSLACLPFLLATALNRALHAGWHLAVFFGQVLLISPLVLAAAVPLCTTPRNVKTSRRCSAGSPQGLVRPLHTDARIKRAMRKYWQ